MKRMVSILMLCTALVVWAGPAPAWWIICWEKKVAGVTKDGKKVYCKKCFSKETEKRPMPKDDCEDFVSEDSAQEFWNKNCDCP